MATIFKFTSQKAKEWAIKQRLIDYFDTVNQGKVSIPSWQAAQIEIDRLKQQGMINFCYRSMQHGIRG